LSATPRPADPGSLKKPPTPATPPSAVSTAIHLLVPEPVLSSIDFELSMRK